jgi:hypothetical protein
MDGKREERETCLPGNRLSQHTSKSDDGEGCESSTEG